MVYYFLFITLKTISSLVFYSKGLLQPFKLENSIFDVTNRAYNWSEPIIHGINFKQEIQCKRAKATCNNTIFGFQGFNKYIVVRKLKSELTCFFENFFGSAFACFQFTGFYSNRNVSSTRMGIMSPIDITKLSLAQNLTQINTVPEIKDSLVSY